MRRAAATLVVCVLLAPGFVAAQTPAAPAPAPETAPTPTPLPAPVPAPAAAPAATDVETPSREVPKAKLQLDPSDPRLQPEYGLAIFQVLTGAVTMYLMLYPVVALANSGGAGGVIGAGLGPLVGGLVVCGIGEISERSDGRCGPTILGAYIGSLSAIPAAFLACPDEGVGARCVEDRAVLFVLGYTVGTALGATIGWHMSKRPAEHMGRARADLSIPSPAAVWLELQARPGLRRLAASRATVPLLALSW